LNTDLTAIEVSSFEFLFERGRIMGEKTNIRKFSIFGYKTLIFLLLIMLVPGCKQESDETDSEPQADAPVAEQQIIDVDSEEQQDQIAAEPDPSIFDMEEFSIFEYEEQMKSRLLSGMPARDCTNKPHKKVTAYHVFKSQKPLYGLATFDMSLVQYGTGIDYYFALDESGGTGTGYDRLYFDVNHDLDLTNDGFLETMENPPAGIIRTNQPNNQEIAFEHLQFNLDYGQNEESCPVRMIPKFWHIAATNRIYFIVPTARKGKIKLGEKEFEAVLSQSSMITGRYDRPMTGLYMENSDEPIPIVSYWRLIDGTFYLLSSTAAGDKISVTPYTGDFGVFEVGAGGPDAKEGKVELGYLIGRNSFIDIGTCPKEDGKLKVPVGDYRPLRLAVRHGQLRVGLGLCIPQPGEEATEPPVLGIKIRKDEPYVLNFSGKPEIVFRNPAASERIKAGDEIKVEAIVHDRRMDVIIIALEDVNQKIGDNIKLPNGTELERFQSIDPEVEITNSSGERVAQGKMPFG